MCITQSLSLTCSKMDIRTAFSNLSSWWVLISGGSRGGAWGGPGPPFSPGLTPPTPPPLILKVWICHCSFHSSVVGVHDPYHVLNVTHLWVRSQYFLFLMDLIHLVLFHSLESLSWYQSSLEECCICNLRRTSWYLGWTQSWACEELHLGRGHHT